MGRVLDIIDRGLAGQSALAQRRAVRRADGATPAYGAVDPPERPPRPPSAVVSCSLRRTEYAYFLALSPAAGIRHTDNVKIARGVRAALAQYRLNAWLFDNAEKLVLDLYALNPGREQDFSGTRSLYLSVVDIQDIRELGSNSFTRGVRRLLRRHRELSALCPQAQPPDT